MHLWVSRYGSSREIMADCELFIQNSRGWIRFPAGVGWRVVLTHSDTTMVYKSEQQVQTHWMWQKGIDKKRWAFPPPPSFCGSHNTLETRQCWKTTRSLISHNTTLYYSTADEDCSLACTWCSNVNAAYVKESDLDSLWAVFVIYSLQFPNVKVAHSLQTLELCLDLSFFL